MGIDLNKNGGKIFKMFSRFNADLPGTGVGLYLVKNIIESQGGEIDVKSQLDQGTTFYLWFKKNYENN